jgi:hypothetical protein
MYLEIWNIGTGGVAQVVECLLCKYEALISNPSLNKKKKKEYSISNMNKTYRAPFPTRVNVLVKKTTKVQL